LQHIFIQGGLNIFIAGPINSRRAASYGIGLSDTGCAAAGTQHSHLVKHNRLLFCRGIFNRGLSLVLRCSVVTGSHD
jgi:hypothetical protein